MRPYSPGGALNALAPALRGSLPQAPSAHRLRRGLPGYLILFAPHAVAPQRQPCPSRPPSPPVFFRISTHSTATPGIPPASDTLQSPSSHRLRRGLPGYLILFATHAFASQCQSPSSWPPSPPVFFSISTNFTSTPRVPPSSPVLKLCSFGRTSSVKLRAFTPDLQSRLHALYAQ